MVISFCDRADKHSESKNQTTLIAKRNIDMQDHMQLHQERISVLDIEEGKMKECVGSFHISKIRFLEEKITQIEGRIANMLFARQI